MTKPLTGDESTWNYRLPDDPSRTMLLLTIGNVLVKGVWTGRYMQYYKAWANMPKRDKAKEMELNHE